MCWTATTLKYEKNKGSASLNHHRGQVKCLSVVRTREIFHVRMLVLDLSHQLSSEIQRLTVSSITTLVALEMVTQVVLVCVPDQRIECFNSQNHSPFLSDQSPAEVELGHKHSRREAPANTAGECEEEAASPECLGVWAADAYSKAESLLPLSSLTEPVPRFPSKAQLRKNLGLPAASTGGIGTSSLSPSNKAWTAALSEA